MLDTWNGYHSLELSPDAKSATTFITEWGRYRYCRGPQGYHGTGDAYARRFDDITANEQRYVRCIDDGCLWDDDIDGITELCSIATNSDSVGRLWNLQVSK